jgi:putative SOS response-associated peptidase YedK
MCGRYTVLTEDEIIEVREIIREVSLRIARESLDAFDESRREVFPTNRAPVVTGTADSNEVVFESAFFGFEKWDGKGVIINARSETAHRKAMFKNHIRNGRCVIPAGGYFEWKAQDTPKAKRKIKHLIKDKNGKLLFLAGLWREGKAGREFVVVTKEPTGPIADIHDRMPVMLRTDQLEDWLSGKMPIESLAGMEYECVGEAFEQPDDVFEQLSLE